MQQKSCNLVNPLTIHKTSAEIMKKTEKMSEMWRLKQKFSKNNQISEKKMEEKNKSKKTKWEKSRSEWRKEKCCWEIEVKVSAECLYIYNYIYYKMNSWKKKNTKKRMKVGWVEGGRGLHGRREKEKMEGREMKLIDVL